MEDEIQLTRHVNETGHVVVVKGKVFVWKQVFDVAHAACQQIVHGNDLVSLSDEPVAQMGT